MTEHRRIYSSQIEINDLIDEAVKNAVARRNEALNSEEALLSVSDAEAKSISGGISSVDTSVILCPIFPICPVVVGLMVPPEDIY
jgi:hypothetical protein